MGLEGKRSINRREFLKSAGAFVATVAVQFPETQDAEAAQRDNRKNEKSKSLERQEKAKPLDPDFAKRLRFTEANYGVKRILEKNFRRIKPSSKVIPQPLRLRNLSITGKLGRFDIEGDAETKRVGRIERALRFKNITDAVELRYNLPPGIILAMVMKESSGADMFPNGLDDGGFGLCHMQPAVAQNFGLLTYDGNARMRDKKHGRELRDIIKREKYDIYKLNEYDERFNRLLNLDAVGRMLATYMSAKPAFLKGPLESAVLRYSGRHNYRRYWNEMRMHMRDIRDQEFLAKVAADFNARNSNLIINDAPLPKNKSPFQAYIETFWEKNENGFLLKNYRESRAYEPLNSRIAMATYRDLLIEKKPRTVRGKVLIQPGR